MCLGGQRLDQLAAGRETGRPQASGQLGDRQFLLHRKGQRLVVERALPDHVHHDRSDPQVEGLELLDRVQGLLDRHLLEQRDQVDPGDVRAQHAHDRVRLVADRSDLGQAGHLVVHVQEPRDPPGRRRVQHDSVVREPPVRLPPRRLVDLAGQQYVAQARRDRGDEVDRAHLLERLPGPAEVVVHVEVLQERGLGVHGQREHLTAAGALRDPALHVRQGRYVEELGEALAALDLDEQDALAFLGQRERHGGRDRGLPGAALAGHHVQSRHRSQGRTCSTTHR